MKKVCVVVGSRANYSSAKSVMRAIAAHPDLELQVVAAASALLDRYGSVVDLILADGFAIAARVHMLIEGETPVTMAKSTGLGLVELPTVFSTLQPDVVLTVGDRFETMATAVAAAYMNIPLAHTMGGEVSGTIDESIRHAITKLAHIHFPASKDAAQRIIRLGEAEENVHLVGCPRIDIIVDLIGSLSNSEPRDLFSGGVGERLDLSQPFVLVSQHPVTTEYGEAKAQITETLEAVIAANLPAIVLWPNADAGSDDLARGIRTMRERGLTSRMHFFKNLPIETYVWLMKMSKCLIGNSSSGIRDAAYIGVPVVNIGTRQANRERGRNVVDAAYDRHSILNAINAQIAHGPYPPDPIYGDGRAGVKIASILASSKVAVQKTITY